MKVTAAQKSYIFFCSVTMETAVSCFNFMEFQ